MADVALGHSDVVYASRPLSGNGQYMPDASTVLNKGGTSSSSDAWGSARLSGIASTDGFKCPPDQDVTIIFPGNSGTGVVQIYDPVAGAWIDFAEITDDLAHVIRAPLLKFRVGMTTHAGATAVKLITQRPPK